LYIADIEELEQQLRDSLPERLTSWYTWDKPEEGSGEKYIEQRFKVHKNGDNKQTFDWTLDELLNNAKSHDGHGERIFTYGEAGLGKTTLLRRITKMWIDKMLSCFLFVFLIPVRFVKRYPVMDIICRDLKLIPKESQDKLKQAVLAHPEQCLFLIDSFEEMPANLQEPDEEEDDLYKLMNRNFLQGATVIATSRPGSNLVKLEQKLSSRITARLQELSSGVV
jgi:Cdc6-like AAA superfamily ATPase